MNEPLRQRRPRLEDPAYLARIREIPCCVCGASAPSDAAHLRMSGAGWGIWGEGKDSTGMAEKPDDCFAVPLCRPRYRPDPVARILNPDKPLKLMHVGCHGLQHGHSIRKIRELKDDADRVVKLEEAFWRSTGKNPFMIAATLYEKFGTGLKPKRRSARRPSKAFGFEPSKDTLKAFGAKIEKPKRKIVSRGFDKTRKRKIPSRRK